MNQSTRSNKTNLTLDSLESRDVPSATVDLSTLGSSGQINGALFQQVVPQPTGTGYIDSFVRIQAKGNGTVEQGYNTDARPLQFDEKSSAEFTHSITVDSLPLVNVGGVNYREFLLDVNQKASASTVSLDELRVYTGTTPNATGYNATTKTLGGLYPVYDMDVGGDKWVKLDARLTSGSGSGDMHFLVPDALLGGSSNYLYLYSKFGTNIAANGGFEEWAKGLDASTPPAQDNATLRGNVYLTQSEGMNLEGYLARLTFTLADGTQVTDDALLTSNGDGTFSYQFNNLLLDGTATATLQLFDPYGNANYIAPTSEGPVDTSLVFILQIGDNTQDVFLF